ncbi:hypothetical protein B0T21DRAFT_255360, partial [Apiosordaria backusii]
RDAIDITRHLGLNYLWIDSLCILQCCEEDWRHESAAMTEVYGNAHINIAATSAEDGRSGCFTNR